MYTDLLNAIEEAKQNDNHESCFVLNENLINSVKSGIITIFGYLDGSKEILTKNNCTIHCVTESTMCPKIMVKYNG